MLLQLYDYLQREKIVSDTQLARQFHLDIKALQPMLEVWLRKGIITFCHEKRCEQRCIKCPNTASTYYQYCVAEDV